MRRAVCQRRLSFLYFLPATAVIGLAVKYDKDEFIFFSTSAQCFSTSAFTASILSVLLLQSHRILLAYPQFGAVCNQSSFTEAQPLMLLYQGCADRVISDTRVVADY